MRISIKCSECKRKHHSHYECDRCHARLGATVEYTVRLKCGEEVPFLFCPVCGEVTEEDQLK